MKKKLVFSGLLVLLVCILFGCEQQGKESEAKSNEQEVKGERLKYEEKKVALAQVSVKDKEKTSSEKTKVPKLKLEKTEEEKKVERKVKRLLKSIERKCKLCGDDIESVGWSIAPEWNVLEKIGNHAIPTMIEVLRDKNRDWRLRFFIAQMMFEAESLQDKKFTNILIEIVGDKTDNVDVRANVADALGRIGSKEIVESLLRILEDEQDANVRLAIVRSFPTFPGDERAINLMAKILRDKNENNIVRKFAACRLGNIGGEKVIRILTESLKDWGKGEKFVPRGLLQVKIGIIWGLGYTKDPRVIDPLIEELRKGDFLAAESLGDLGKEMKGNDKDRIVEALIESLKHKDGVVVGDVAKALGKIGDRRVLDPLEEILRNLKTTRGGYGERMIIYALADIGVRERERERVIKILEEILQKATNEGERRDITNILEALKKEKYYYHCID